MKKLFISFAFLFAVSAFAATFTHPGWKCTDVAKIDAALAVAPDDFSKYSLQCLKQLALTPPKTFADVVETAKKIGGKDNQRLISPFVKAYARAHSELVKDAFVWSKTNPCRNDFFFYMVHAEELRLTPDEVYAAVLKCLLTYNYNAKRIAIAVNHLVDLSTKTSKSCKNDFQKLNRRFSKYLLKDKATWEPIIALIRTTIDTF